METPLLKKIIKQEKAMKLYKALLKLIETEVIILEPETSYIQATPQMALNRGITFMIHLLSTNRNLESYSQAMRSKQK